MKATKILYLPLTALFLLFACEKFERDIYSNEDGRFVRFNLMVNNDGLPVDHSVLNTNAKVVNIFDNKSKETLKIPVTLTSEILEQQVSVNFSTQISGNFDGLDIYPTETLSFNGSQLSDTIYISFYKRWDHTENNSILFKLESISDPEIQIGFPNSKAKNDELEIQLDEISMRYQFPVSNMLEINGEKGETVTFQVLFPDGFFLSEVENTELISLNESEYAYSIVQLPIDEENNLISYEMTVEENILDDEFSFKNIFELNELPGYTLSGSNKITIVKPERIERDNNVNAAANFYNLSDSYYRTYGETWMDYNKDGICTWTNFNAFTYPVVVDSDHPNAVLYDDKGTVDLSDDVYHHAFRIGFNSPNAGRTTNAFNLKRVLDNEYTDADKSPGFNVPTAIEFYPTDGTSTTNGRVKIIPQEITLASKDDNSYDISIEGEGEYSEIASEIFKMTFELRLTNTELFGGTMAVQYILYNTKEYEDPEDLTDGCFMPVDL